MIFDIMAGGNDDTMMMMMHKKQANFSAAVLIVKDQKIYNIYSLAARPIVLTIISHPWTGKKKKKKKDWFVIFVLNESCIHVSFFIQHVLEGEEKRWCISIWLKRGSFNHA